MDKGEMKAGAARVAINLEDVLPLDGFDALRHEIFARAFVVEGMGRRASSSCWVDFRTQPNTSSG